MDIYQAYLLKSIPRPVLPFAYLVLIIGGLVDIVMNFTVFSLFFWEFPQLNPKPREFLLTQRLKRVKNSPIAWKNKLANIICKYILNPFTTNHNHCG